MDGVSLQRLGETFVRVACPWYWGFAIALVLPFLLLSFLVTGPHSVGESLGWMFPVLALILLDCLPWREDRRINSPKADIIGNGLLVLIALAAPLNVIALGYFVDALAEQWASRDIWETGTDLVALRVLGGTTFCCSVIAPAHEMMHRRPRWVRRGARVLLMLVFSDLFYLSHGSGHHRHLGTHKDPSTARSGELYSKFLRRSLITQWQLAREHYPKAFRRGLVIQGLLLLSFGMVFGVLAALAWLYLSAVAVRLLEAVNYFQHYGLTEEGGQAVHTAWHCDRALSFFLFLGLTRHADHHRRPNVSFTDLEPEPSGPHLPAGYLGTAIWVKNHSRSYGRMADAKLKRLVAEAS